MINKINMNFIFCISFIMLGCAGMTNIKTVQAEWERRADVALDAMLQKFWSDDMKYFRSASPNNGKRTSYWMFAQAWDTLLDGVERTHGEKFKDWIDIFYQAQDSKGWMVGMFDDENWMALALLRSYDLTGNSKYLKRAIFLMDDIMTHGWDESCCGREPGGVWWDKNHTQKATASNAGPVITSARLYWRTRNPSYLSFALRCYDYWRQTMINPQTFQVTDHIKADGTKVFWKFTYNEGLMIGAGVELFRATGDARYLEDAHREARFMIEHEVSPSQFGPVLTDGSNEKCSGDAQQFKGIAFRYLMLLYQQDFSRREYFRVLKASAEATWNLAWDAALQTFAVNWTGPRMKRSSLAQHSAAASALNLFALLNSNPPLAKK